LWPAFEAAAAEAEGISPLSVGVAELPQHYRVFDSRGIVFPCPFVFFVGAEAGVGKLEGSVVKLVGIAIKVEAVAGASGGMVLFSCASLERVIAPLTSSSSATIKIIITDFNRIN